MRNYSYYLLNILIWIFLLFVYMCRFQISGIEGATGPKGSIGDIGAPGSPGN